MGAESLQVGEHFNRAESFFQSRLIIFDDAGSPLKLIDGQPGKRCAGSASWQRVTWSGHIVAENRRRKWAKENSAGCENAEADGARITRHDFAMFRRNLIHQLHRVIQGADLNNQAT